jgi:alanyl-tRNA synthetase
VQALLDERKALQAELAGLKRQIALGGTGASAEEPEAREINGVKFFARSLTGISPKDLRGLIDEHKSRLGSGAVLLIAETDGKAAIAAGVTEDLTARISAVDLVRAAVEAVGGKGGGGRPDMAQGGGPDASKAEAAIQAAEALLAG